MFDKKSIRIGNVTYTINKVPTHIEMNQYQNLSHHYNSSLVKQDSFIKVTPIEVKK